MQRVRLGGVALLSVWSTLFLAPGDAWATPQCDAWRLAVTDAVEMFDTGALSRLKGQRPHHCPAARYDAIALGSIQTAIRRLKASDAPGASRALDSIPVDTERSLWINALIGRVEATAALVEYVAARDHIRALESAHLQPSALGSRRWYAATYQSDSTPRTTPLSRA